MSTWSFYDPGTGLFSGRRCCCSRKLLSLNTPAGYAAVEGAYDPKSERVDIETGAVVAYQRPASEVDAEQRAARAQHARQRIEELERAQLRPVRELLIDPTNTAAKRRLQDIESEIAAKRADLSP